jgi:ribosomal protein S18 acetylase RimI-like enzyme
MSGSLHMFRRWSPGEVSREASRTGVSVRQVTSRDAGVVGLLLWRGFGRDGPDGYASEDRARAEARDTLRGKWGPMIWQGSVVGLVDRVPVAVSIVVRDDVHDLRPLLAFLATDPGRRGRGLGQLLVQETLVRLDGLGVRELHLAVDRENPARRLYERLGFRDAAT